MKPKALALIPAYNEELKIRSVIEGIKSIGISDILVVNDGSTDDTSRILRSLDIITIDLSKNYGAGYATATGFHYADVNNYEYLITVDADGQHETSDIAKIFDYISTKSNADIVIGERVTSMWKENKPRFIFNIISNIFFFVLTGIYFKDTQSGLKAFRKSAINKIKIESNRYEFCFEILLKAKKNKLKVEEIPIKAIYTDYSIRKGQSLFNAFNLLSRLFKLWIMIR